jgi:hypothetical protein
MTRFAMALNQEGGSKEDRRKAERWLKRILGGLDLIRIVVLAVLIALANVIALSGAK